VTWYRGAGPERAVVRVILVVDPSYEKGAHPKVLARERRGL
jgi:hypothetical protein